MSLVSTNIPNLINGVSQQADTLKFATQANEQINGNSSIVEGLTKRNPSRHIKKMSDLSVSDAFVHFINRDSTEQYVLVISNETPKIFSLSGEEKILNFVGTSLQYLNTSNPAAHFRALTVADYTFILNNSKTVAMSSELSPSTNIRTVVEVKSGAFSTTYNVTIDGYKATYTSGDSTNVNNAKVSQITGGLGGALVSTLQSLNLGYGVSYNQDEGLIFITKSPSGTLIPINSGAASDSANSDALLLTVNNQVQTRSELPTKYVDGVKCKVTGYTEDGKGDYWMKFKAFASPANGAGTWQETSAPSEVYKFDATTMPHILVRLSNGQFVLGPCNGQTVTYGGVSYTFPEWGTRKTGTLQSNANPSFVGKTINDICFFRSRLGFIADENVIMSEANEFFNFFRTDVTSLLDSDPIDVSTSHTKVSIINHAIPFSEKLVLFSDQSQFYLSGGADILTPKTASIRQTTDFASFKYCKPVVVGKNIFFAFDRGSSSGIMEYFLTQDTLEFNAVDLTAPIPKYIAGSAIQIASCNNENMVALLTSDYRKGLYIYRYFVSDVTTNQKIQSSWSKWEFDKAATLLGMEFINTVLYLVISRPDGIYLEKINVEAGVKDTYSSFCTRLDRRITEDATGVVASYNSVLDRTTFTIPYTVATGDRLSVVTRATQTEKEGIIPTYIGQTSNSITVKGNYSSASVWIGVVYDFIYQFSRPLIRLSSGNGKVAITDGRFQVKSGLLTFADSLYFKVAVTPPYRDTFYYTFTGPELGTGGMVLGEMNLQQGVFRFPILSNSEGLSITLTNDSPFPSSLLSVDWEAFYTVRSRRI